VPIERVAVGFDRSPAARRAFMWASSLCCALNASLLVVHAVGLLEEAHLAPVCPPSDAEIQQLAGQSGLPPDRVFLFVEDGPATDVLLRQTVHPRAFDLLVLGSGGTGTHDVTTLGRTSLEVAARSSVPVVIVPNPT
jgi:nucleotide-binding universal stress UspA family protein